MKVSGAEGKGERPDEGTPMFTHPDSRLERERRLARRVAEELASRGKISWRTDGALVFRVHDDSREIEVSRRSDSPFGRFVTAVLGVSTMVSPIRRALHVVVSQAEEYRDSELARDAKGTSQ